MTYIVYAKINETLLNRIGPEAIKHYSSLIDFLPLLKRRGKVVLIEKPREQVDAVHQFLRYLQEPTLCIAFSPPDKAYSLLQCPKVFITSPPKFEQNANATTIDASLGFALTSTHTFFSSSERAKINSPSEIIRPPVWDQYQQLATQLNLRETTISTNGHLIDSNNLEHRSKAVVKYLPLKTSLQASYLALKKREFRLAVVNLIYRKSIRYFPIKLNLKGVVYTTIIKQSDPYESWKQIIIEFCETFKEQFEATLVVKMVGVTSKRIERAAIKLLSKQSVACRVIFLTEHLPQAEYENLIRATSFFISCSTDKEIRKPVLEFMSAGRPLLMFQVANERLPNKTQLLQSFLLRKNDNAKYLSMSRAASQSMKNSCSLSVIEPAFSQWLDNVETQIRQGPSLNPGKITINQNLDDVL